MGTRRVSDTEESGERETALSIQGIGEGLWSSCFAMFFFSFQISTSHHLRHFLLGGS